MGKHNRRYYTWSICSNRFLGFQHIVYLLYNFVVNFEYAPVITRKWHVAVYTCQEVALVGGRDGVVVTRST